MLFRRRSSLSPAAREALARTLDSAAFELIPLKNVHDQAGFLPAGAVVSVTASPAKGLEATLELCEQLEAKGFQPVPHLSARMVRDRAHLADLLARAQASGLRKAFVVGGDAKEPGEFLDGLSLLQAMAEIGHPFDSVGIPCYPQGHAVIPDDALLTALRDKAPFASYMTTQLCFDPGAIASWLEARRAEGIVLPAVIGVPGVAEPQKLLSISARIGVADTQRFVKKNLGFVVRLARSGGFYKPDAFLRDLAPVIADESKGIAGLHLYTFNAVDLMESWRRGFVDGLRAAPVGAGA
jgi:methylenetetrahydrofolate reductase (NADPH)